MKSVHGNWTGLISNPLQMTNLYSCVPDLDQVQVSGIELGHRLDLTIKIILQDLPDRIPARWRRMKYRAVEIELDFREIKDFLLSGYETDRLFTFSFSRDDQGWIRFEGKSDGGNISGFCRDMYVQRVTPN